MRDSEKIENLGDRLRRLRTRRGLSVDAVSQALGVAPSTYREWENGRAIRGEPYLGLRDIFGVSLEELLTGHRGVREEVLREIDRLEDQVKLIRTEVLRLL